MDIVSLIISLNKISLGAFLATLVILSYEIYLLKKEKKIKTTPKIPKFDPNLAISSAEINATKIEVNSEPVSFNRPNRLVIIILTIMMIVFGTITFYSIFKVRPTKTVGKKNEVIIQEVASAGIKIYSPNWKELTDSELLKSDKNYNIIIGIITIPEADIDRARIRVNESRWRPEHITDKFNKDKNVYYREYQVASGESNLKIEAQLHSVRDGWLGE